MESIVHEIAAYFSRYGYWTLVVALLLENAGVPVPGETVLLVASFLAYSTHELELLPIILIASAAAAAGDNIGYGLGRWGGRPLLNRYRHLFHISERSIGRGERLFHRYGAAGVFFARFIFGMRVLAGPLSGVLCMPWKVFATFNVLGAVTWVTAVSVLGYTFGRHWQDVVPILGRVELIVIVVLAAGAALVWWRYRAGNGEGETE